MKLRGYQKMRLERVAGFKWLYVPQTEEELEVTLREFRMDSRRWNYAPAWFRRELNRILRHKESQQTRRLLYNDLDEYSYAPRRNNARWLWT
jgi:hypothetical protein